MADDDKRMIINQDDLIAKLNELHNECGGDLAMVVERLLLENHVLALDRSSGFRRGVNFEFADFPRFLKVQNSENTN